MESTHTKCVKCTTRKEKLTTKNEDRNVTNANCNSLYMLVTMIISVSDTKRQQIFVLNSRTPRAHQIVHHDGKQSGTQLSPLRNFPPLGDILSDDTFASWARYDLACKQAATHFTKARCNPKPESLRSKIRSSIRSKPLLKSAGSSLAIVKLSITLAT